jgi:hypothetical protein
MTIFPYKSGDFTVIGPECFTDSEARIIAYKGSNYVRVPDDTTIVRIASTKEAARLAANHAAFEVECPPVIDDAPKFTT